MPTRVKIFFDGACRGVHGDLAIAVVTRGRTTLRTGIGRGSSSDAEWLALIEALTIARGLRTPDVLLLGDSADVIAKARGLIRCDRGAQHHLARVHALLGDAALPRARRIKRSQNLAGIALDAYRA